MSIPNEALQKLIREIESQALVAQQQIGLARTQMNSKQREQRLIKLTMSEMASLPHDAIVYEGVGKMPATDFGLFAEHRLLQSFLLTLLADFTLSQTLTAGFAEITTKKTAWYYLTPETVHHWRETRDHVQMGI
ncbi:prefoldin subunit 1 [Fusarium heterosporum]|uniref:Prefoldin subunit 1 n=1 Tax=Fusarium heterosporum TaxID=42747 RepID=A0A8H5T876_FUSHE|nr:prefoldin subunit 1 [Fusarium heterosporum]